MNEDKVMVVERRYRLTRRTCVVCGQRFHGWGRQRFCSKPCQRHWDYRQHVESRREKRRARYARQKEEQQP